MFQLLSIASLAVFAVSAVNGVVVPRRDPPAGWATSYLEDYHVYHTRYLALSCQTQHNTEFFNQCCHPLLVCSITRRFYIKTRRAHAFLFRLLKTLATARPAQCIPSTEASSSAAAAEPTSTVTTPVDTDDDCEDDGDGDSSSVAPATSQVATAAPSSSKVATAPPSSSKVATAVPSSSVEATNTPVSSSEVKTSVSVVPTSSFVPTTSASPVPTTSATPVPTTSSASSSSSTLPKPTPTYKPTTSSTSAPAAASTSPASGSGGDILGGFATFFYQNGVAGACGTVHSDEDFIAAIDQARYGNSGATSELCGKQVQITNTANQKTVTVTIADDCPTCNNGNSIDLSKGAFLAIAEESTGIVDIAWKFV
ncbi:hypothetical protein EW146_g737 [Bondarzewia mesenterica]|uniref:RlpA-like protein double-psi beta-barrel domain-containing protein n=1 Tax=Bondarzewia mesenterica TaxID=1095465 RepID=A0A4S4M6I7_9AGAM|nr:hypothetical protein EW146_g737 [Bondarzewia mesenterica]